MRVEVSAGAAETMMPSRKRLLDVCVAGIAVVAAFPVLAIVGFAIFVTMGRPVFFRQLRPGLHGKPFNMLKFRTMTNGADASGALLPDAERLTRVGRFLRSTSLDELPELLNVLRGEMSLVGPRPLLMEYLERYTPEQARRHDVKPGITGWAQINGRQSIPFSKRIELDLWYIDNQSLWLDLRILMVTGCKAFIGLDVRSGQDVAGIDDLAPATRNGESQ